MAAVVNIDAIEGSAASHHLIQGWAITRVAVVTGLTVAADTAALFKAALDAVIAVTGDRGSACPSISVPTYLEQFIPELIDATSVRVRIVYKGYPLVVWEYDGGLNQVESNLDINGSVVSVSYAYPSNYALDPRKAGLTITQGGMVRRSMPEPVITVRILIVPATIGGVARDASYCMAYYKAGFEGKVNSAAVTLGYLYGDVHCWLCEKVHGITRDGGGSYEASFTFHLRYQTWDEPVVFTNPDDGKPPADLVSGTGYKLVRTQPEVAFSGLPSLAVGAN
jgi:hypothetical protein